MRAQPLHGRLLPLLPLFLCLALCPTTRAYSITLKPLPSAVKDAAAAAAGSYVLIVGGSECVSFRPRKRAAPPPLPAERASDLLNSHSMLHLRLAYLCIGCESVYAAVRVVATAIAGAFSSSLCCFLVLCAPI